MSTMRDNDDADIINAQLSIGNQVYTVRTIVDGSVRVIADSGSESSLHLPESDANDLVNEYNL